MTIQNCDGSLVCSEVSSIPISIPSIPATYRFLNILPSSAFKGGSITTRCPLASGTNSIPSILSSSTSLPLNEYSSLPILGLYSSGVCLNNTIRDFCSVSSTVLKVSSPSNDKASSGVQQYSAQCVSSFLGLAASSSLFS